MESTQINQRLIIFFLRIVEYLYAHIICLFPNLNSFLGCQVCQGTSNCILVQNRHHTHLIYYKNRFIPVVFWFMIQFFIFFFSLLAEYIKLHIISISFSKLTFLLLVWFAIRVFFNTHQLSLFPYKVYVHNIGWLHYTFFYSLCRF